MTTMPPIWPTELDHLCLESDDPEAIVDFYGRALGFAPEALDDGTWLLTAPERRMVVCHGEKGARRYHGFRVSDGDQLRGIEASLETQGVATTTVDSPIFGEDTLCVRDPDGWRLLFGVPKEGLPATGVGPAAALPARLQHVVVATDNLPRLMDFYGDTLGLRPSDYIYKGDDASNRDADHTTVAFFRGNDEHHLFAAFAAAKPGPDHHCYETTCWNDIRDWADHLADLDIPLWWGPGRHGPGNNLFFMIQDPDGCQVELSAEIEHIAADAPPRWWEASPKAINLWGQAWERS